MHTHNINWGALASDPRFINLHRKKSRFLWGLMAFSMAYYLLLPLGAAYTPQLFAIKVWGPMNVGLLFALSEFIVAWSIAVIYSRRANREFDQLAAELMDHVQPLLGKSAEERRATKTAAKPNVVVGVQRHA